ncbi:MAG: carbon starvation protein A, partial [Bacteroidales bacterium]|nr:carbon starvation protein A [Bacteroidales bacterium]
MISFIACFTVLIAGYFLYGSYVDKIFKPEKSHITPAFKQQDGIDYVPLPSWKIFLIQFLNIAGLGPIFGALMGAMYGPVVFLWITLGTIFAGGVHDYFSGMISERYKGESLPEIVGRFLGIPVRTFMRFFTIILMILVGTVFVSGPADILDKISGGVIDVRWWMALIFVYFIVSTIFPIDKIIGKIYPVFGFALLFMAVG